MGVISIVAGVLLSFFGALSESQASLQLKLSEYQAPTSRAEFCRKLRAPGEVRRQLFNPQNRLGFSNPGGWFQIGTCWWHSRMQRAATYLAVYRPELPKPTAHQALQIIDRIFTLKGVVEVPGYWNLSDFSREWAGLMAQYFSYKQVEETAHLNFLRGLRPLQMSSDMLMKQAHRIYRSVAGKDKIQYLALKSERSFLESHAWLVVDAQQTVEGFDFYVLDSNDSPQITPNKISYKNGDNKLGGVVPYLQHDSDYWLIGLSVNQYCR